MVNVLIVGASRGLGASLVKEYASSGENHVYATVRSSEAPKASKNITYIPDVDMTSEFCGQSVVDFFNRKMEFIDDHINIDIVIITAGYFETETFEHPDHGAEVEMYKTSSIGPVFMIREIVSHGGLVPEGGKIILVSSESGSITLRHESEGGGNYGHHASKAALNMVGKLLSLDLKEMGIAVGIVHPGFMRTEMTKDVGFDQFWDSGGAVTPDEAASSLVDFIDKFDIKSTGEFWAPRGPRDIGTAEHVLGKGLPTPLQLPW